MIEFIRRITELARQEFAGRYASKSGDDIIDIKNHMFDEDVLHILKESIYDLSGTGKHIRERTEQYAKDENTYAYG